MVSQPLSSERSMQSKVPSQCAFLPSIFWLGLCPLQKWSRFFTISVTPELSGWFLGFWTPKVDFESGLLIVNSLRSPKSATPTPFIPFQAGSSQIALEDLANEIFFALWRVQYEMALRAGKVFQSTCHPQTYRKSTVEMFEQPRSMINMSLSKLISDSDESGGWDFWWSPENAWISQPTPQAPLVPPMCLPVSLSTCVEHQG